MDDILDIDASMEGKSSTIDSCLQGTNGEEQCIEEQWQMEQKEQTRQFSQMQKTQHVQEHLWTQQQHPPEMVRNDLVKWKELYKQYQQPSQIEERGTAASWCYYGRRVIYNQQLPPRKEDRAPKH